MFKIIKKGYKWFDKKLGKLTRRHLNGIPLSSFWLFSFTLYLLIY